MGTSDEEMDTLSDEEGSPEPEYDLPSVLSPDKFPFKGYFFHAAHQANAPNPCIKLNGHGVLGLPLNERDVPAVLSNTSSKPLTAGGPSGGEMQQNLWEFAPTEVTFSNPLWNDWIEGICKEVSARLGLELGKDKQRRPKMEFSKLQLCGKEGHVTQPGCGESSGHGAGKLVGTVVILLPSEYAGGQIEVLHSRTKRTVDFSAKSSFSVAVFASHLGLQTRMQPVTSGYCLALLYDVVHPHEDFVPPSLPDNEDFYVKMQTILRAWRDSGNGQENYAIFMMQRHYDDALVGGEWCLRGVDRQRVAVIRDVADTLGLIVRLGTVQHLETGSGGEGDFEPPFPDHRIGQDDEDDSNLDVPIIDEGMVDDLTHTRLKHAIFDLEGNLYPGSQDLEVEDEELLPPEPFENMKPTSWEFVKENPSVVLYLTYSRTALLVIKKDYSDEFHWFLGKMAYAVERLKHSAVPLSPSDSQWLKRTMEYLSSKKPYEICNDSDSEEDPDYKSIRRQNKKYLLELLDLTVKWNDATTWNNLIDTGMYSLYSVNSERIVQAWRTFGFEHIQSGLEKFLKQAPTLDGLEFIYSLPDKSSEGEIDSILKWCHELVDKMLSSFWRDLSTSSSFVKVLHAVGNVLFEKWVMPKILNSHDRDLNLDLARTLRENRQEVINRQAELLARPRLMSVKAEGGVVNLPISEHLATAQAAVDRIIKQCLESAASNWYIPIPEKPSYSYNKGAKPVEVAPEIERAALDSFIGIVDQAILSGHQQVCKPLFIDILKRPGSPGNKFDTLYTPLISELLQLLHKRGQDFCSPPFIDILQVLIALYLHDILGSKTDISIRRLRRLGCGCDQCEEFDDFALDPTKARFSVRAKQQIRDHFEELLKYASDLCTWTTDRRGSPLTLKITKRPEIMRPSTREGRVEEANEFLAKIGPEDVIRKIMGTRYTDVQDALSGLRPFGSSSAPPNATTAIETSSSSSVGRKRKLAEVDVELS